MKIKMNVFLEFGVFLLYLPVIGVFCEFVKILCHKKEHLAYDFGKLPKLLTHCGFKEYTEFHNRKPVWVTVS